eukprot:CAMPEP_0195106880 /NCGR_PEP_ID=MMETSP0448-20130528/81750_1 /TAXON_ID=66468 /ORGANISM="Heterocapsa triquestra, Strain CCMP 448" /LENGTH=50 /DNA_ID=CAMNT_0040143229 /DNA_START=299 /DNA_END=448 /DNA_ORIENTATION=+
MGGTLPRLAPSVRRLPSAPSPAGGLQASPKESAMWDVDIQNASQATVAQN